jgi:hypothetical protein
MLPRLRTVFCAGRTGELNGHMFGRKLLIRSQGMLLRGNLQ